jgi:endonuclease/exonuclease/phosphatase family metal-dependent hydrolase
MIVPAEALRQRLRDFFSRSEWLARFLNIAPPKGISAEPGLVMIQIDGLSLTQLERAITKGHMPFLSRLLNQEQYSKYRHYTGIPSNTPAVQGMLFYGVKACVAAFSFRDNRNGQVGNMFTPATAAAVEAVLKDKGEALLDGGSAYGDIFTGGAKEARFCAASIGWGSLLKVANPAGVPFTLLFNLHILAGALLLAVVEFFLALIDSFRGIIFGEKLREEIQFIPLRVMVCVVLREIVEMSVRIDIARGIPVIHANFAGYDEQAHHRGPTSAFAHWSLHGIDGAIRRVWKSARRSRPRDYDVIIYSDHGQEETVDYPTETGRSLEEAVAQVFSEKISAGGWKTTPFIPSNPHWRAQLLRNPANKPVSAAPVALAPAVEGLEKQPDLNVTITAMGPLGHIYLPQALTSSESEMIARKLVDEAKIPLVMRADGTGRVFAWNAQGRFALPDEADKVIQPDHPYFDEVKRDLVDLCHHPDAGMFVISGWRQGAKSLTFRKGEQGSHAGPGVEETNAFALLPFGVLPRHLRNKKAIDTLELRQIARSLLGHPVEHKPAAEVASGAVATVLRIMTYNVHGCMGRDGKVSPERIARIIARHEPDVIALQALNMREGLNQAEVIARKLSMPFHFRSAVAAEQGRIGNAIFSRFPMRLVQAQELPRFSKLPLVKPRGALWVEIELPGKKVQVLNTHLSLYSAEGLVQAQALLGNGWLKHPACAEPVILCGDFNALRQSKIGSLLEKTLKNTRVEPNRRGFFASVPSYPGGPGDHIFVSPEITVKASWAPKTDLEKTASDHLPLITEIEIAGPSPAGEPASTAAQQIS